MTAAVIDPATAIADAGRQLLDELRELLDRADASDVPGLLDQVRRALRRASTRVNRATKTQATPAGEKPAVTPAQPAPTPAPAVVPTGPPTPTTSPVPTSAPAPAAPLAPAPATGLPVRPAERPPAPAVRPVGRRWLIPVVGMLAVLVVLAVALLTYSPVASAAAVAGSIALCIGSWAWRRRQARRHSERDERR